MAQQGILPAYRLESRVEADRMIEEYVNEILDLVSDGVNAAIGKRLTVATVSVPTIFYIASMHNEDAQRHVYFHAIQALERARYAVRTRFINSPHRAQQVLFIVTWRSQEDAESDRLMDKFIAQHTY